MSEENKRFTVQEDGTPVPVGDRSKRVCSPRPSANDRSVRPVGNQAGTLDIVTGKTPLNNEVFTLDALTSAVNEWEKNADPFQRRSSIQRSPLFSRRGSNSS